MSARGFQSEKALMAPLPAHYQSMGWETVSEVSFIGTVGEKISIDLVATKVDTVVSIQGKLSLNPKAIAQAQAARRYAHFSTIVVPHPGHCPSAEHKVNRRTCRHERVGLIYVTQDLRVKRELRAIKNPMADFHRVCDALSAARKLDQPAGTPSPLGARAAQQRDKWQALRDWLAEGNEGATTSEAKHALNLSKPQQSELVTRLSRGDLPGVRGEGAPFRMYLMEA